jgi:hypothetical protein
MSKLRKKTISLCSDKFVYITHLFHALVREAKYSVFTILKIILFVFLMQFEGLCLFSDKFVSLLMMKAHFALNYLCHTQSN